jgi:hypothetical protein
MHFNSVFILNVYIYLYNVYIYVKNKESKVELRDYKKWPGSFEKQMCFVEINTVIIQSELIPGFKQGF